jgi:hypothetical protein
VAVAQLVSVRVVGAAVPILSLLQSVSNRLNYHKHFPLQCNSAPEDIPPEIDSMISRFSSSIGRNSGTSVETTATWDENPALEAFLSGARGSADGVSRRLASRDVGGEPSLAALLQNLGVSTTDGHVARTDHKNEKGQAETIEIVKAQVCQYAFLNRFAQVARAWNITWSLVAGSMVSARCFNSMNPWDDDIDVMVAPADCAKLHALWEAARETQGKDQSFFSRPDWNHRIYEDLAIYARDPNVHRSKLQDGACFFKFRLANASGTVPISEIGDLGGMDVVCTGCAGETGLQTESGFTAALAAGEVAPVEFGPGTAMMVSPAVADKYVHLRGWTCDVDHISGSRGALGE